MGPKIVFKFIGVLFFHDWLLSLIYIGIFIFLLIKGMKRPSYLIALYFITSIVNPQLTFQQLYAMPLVLFASIGCFISLIINQGTHRFRMPAPYFTILLFLLASLVSYLSAQVPELAGKRFGEFNNVAIIIFLTIPAIKERADYSFISGSALCSVYFLVLKNLVDTQLIGKWDNLHGSGGWLGDSNDWALAIAMTLPLSYGAILLAKSRKGKIFHVCACVSTLLVLTITSSRGGFLGAAAASFVWLLTEKKRTRAIIMAFVGLFIVSLYMPTGYIERIRSISDASQVARESWEGQGLDKTEYTGGERTYFWRIAAEMAKDHPFTGVGWGNYVNSRKYYEVVPSTEVAHSTWFQVLAEAGYTGLFAFVLMILVSMTILIRFMFKRACRDDAWLFTNTRILLAGMIGYCVSGTFVSREYSDLFFLYFALILALPVLANTGEKKQQDMRNAE